MKIEYGWVAVCLAMALCAGCVGYRSSAPAACMPLRNAKTTASFDVIGNAEGSASGGTLFGFIAIGGERKSGRLGSIPSDEKRMDTKKVVSTVFFPPLILYWWKTSSGSMDPVEQTALFNAIESVPSADMLLMPRAHVERSNYIVYSEKTVTVKGKAIRLNKSAN